jgi:hypothetical protein
VAGGVFHGILYHLVSSCQEVFSSRFGNWGREEQIEVCPRPPPPLKVKIDYVLKKTDAQIVNSVYSRMSRLRGKKHGTPCNW